MARPQVRDLGGPESLQQTARPVVQQAVASGQGVARAQQLAESLSSLSPALMGLKQQFDKNDELEARQLAQSMTVKDLGRMVDEGKIPANKSPVFVGTLQHIYGENRQQEMERETLSKIQTGELTFNTPKDLEDHLVGQRNEFLSNQSQYTTAGFDKRFEAFKQKSLDYASKRNSDEMVKTAEQEGSTSLSNFLKTRTGDEVPAEFAGQMVERYRALKQSRIFGANPDIGRRVLKGLVTEISATGDRELLKAVLDSTADGSDGGPKLRSIIGVDDATVFEARTEQAYYGQQRELIDNEMLPFRLSAAEGEMNEQSFMDWANASEARQKVLGSGTVAALIAQNRNALLAKRNQADKIRDLANQAILTDNAKSNALTLFAQGTPEAITDVFVGTKTLTKKELLDGATRTWEERNPNAPVDLKVALGAKNGVDMASVTGPIKSAGRNLNEIAYERPDPKDPNGQRKITGVLSPATARGIETFRQAYLANPTYVKDQIGGPMAERLERIDMLMNNGFPMEVAAAWSNAVDTGNRSPADFEKVKETVQGAGNELVERGLLTWLGGQGYRDARLTQGAIQGRTRKIMETLLLAGAAGDTKTAAEMAIQALKPNLVTSGRAVYHRADLPQAPNGEDLGEWITRYREHLAVQRGEDAGDLVLMPTTGGFMLSKVGGFPLSNGFIAKSSVDAWFKETSKGDLSKLVAKDRANRNNPLPTVQQYDPLGNPIP